MNRPFTYCYRVLATTKLAQIMKFLQFIWQWKEHVWYVICCICCSYTAICLDMGKVSWIKLHKSFYGFSPAPATSFQSPAAHQAWTERMSLRFNYGSDSFRSSQRVYSKSNYSFFVPLLLRLLPHKSFSLATIMLQEWWPILQCADLGNDFSNWQKNDGMREMLDTEPHVQKSLGICPAFSAESSKPPFFDA